MTTTSYVHPIYSLIDPATPDVTQMLIAMMGLGALKLKRQPKPHIWPKVPKTDADHMALDAAAKRRARRRHAALINENNRRAGMARAAYC